MLASHIEVSLADIEWQFNQVTAALISGEPLALVAASGALR